MIEVKRIEGKTTQTKMATVRILSGVILGKGIEAKKGDVFELPRHTATTLVAFNQAEIVLADALDPEEYGVRIETPSSRDPKPKRK